MYFQYFLSELADVSGSMFGRPMETSIGLAIYFAERNKGDYHNLYMTFTDEPHFIQLREGATLKENVDQVMHTDVGFDTDLEEAFSYILEHAIRGNVKSEDMPEALVVISDMERKKSTTVSTLSLTLCGSVLKKQVMNYPKLFFGMLKRVMIPSFILMKMLSM